MKAKIIDLLNKASVLELELILRFTRALLR
jgi:hypothetical protein